MIHHLEVSSLQALGDEGVTLFPPLTFAVRPGEVVFFHGDNGAGKSTLLKTILGLHKRYRGQFKLHLAYDEIQYLPQLTGLHFHLPLCLEDLVVASGGEESALLVGVDLKKKWNTASGGERQKVLLAAALAKAPRLLILDEPFNHVDKASGELLEEALRQFLERNPQSSLVLVSHRALSQPWQGAQIVELK